MSAAPTDPPTPRGKPATFTGAPLGKLAQPSERAWVVLAETLLLPLMAIALGMFANPEDPFWVRAPYPWSWLAPTLVALRYGPLAGLGAAGVLLLGWLALHVDHIDLFPQIYFLGGLVSVMVVGEFSSLWRTRTRRAETIQYYLDQRLEHLIRQYYLLRLSHDRLEQELIGRPMSMRDALKTLHAVGSQDAGPETLLRLLAQYCQITSAALYAVANEAVTSATPLAQIGAPQPLLADDALAQQALETRKLCHVVQALNDERQSAYLVAAPLLDLGGDVYNLLLVSDLPFFALQQENLQTINLLLGYYTDGLSAQALAHPLQQQAPGCPLEFAFELQRLWRMRKSTGVPSVIVALEFNAIAQEHNLPQQFLRQKRLMDESWLLQSPQRTLLAILMPLGDAATAEGFLARMENWMRQKENTPLAAAGVFPHILAVDEDPAHLLHRLQVLAHG